MRLSGETVLGKGIFKVQKSQSENVLSGSKNREHCAEAEWCGEGVGEEVGAGQVTLGLWAIVRIWAFTLYDMRSLQGVLRKGIFLFDLSF